MFETLEADIVENLFKMVVSWKITSQIMLRTFVAI